MKQQRRKVRPRDLCARLHDDDTVDPRKSRDDGDDQDNNDNRKTRQLCKQAFRAISAAMTGECHNNSLQALEVIRVDPAPNAGRLQVTVAVESPGPGEPVIRAALERVTGFLRGEVARAITRKRAPELTFRVIPHQEEGHESAST